MAIECLSTHDGKQAAIAELYVKGKNRMRMARDQWEVKYANSENLDGNHTGDKAFDLQESTYWQTEPSAATPHLLVIDMGSEQTITAIDYLPRMESGAPGSVKAYRVYVY